MKKWIRILPAAACVAFLAAGPANAYDYREAAYRTHMYSDGTYTTEVGTIEPECGYSSVQYHLVGTYTYYQQDEFVGYCTQDGWEPI
jgi:hypothetical protein